MKYAAFTHMVAGDLILIKLDTITYLRKHSDATGKFKPGTELKTSSGFTLVVREDMERIQNMLIKKSNWEPVKI